MDGNRSVGEGIPPDPNSELFQFGLALTSSTCVLSNKELENVPEGMHVDVTTDSAVANVSMFQSQYSEDRNSQTPGVTSNSLAQTVENNTGMVNDSVISDSNAVKTPKPVYKYSQSDIGPFIVYVENNLPDFKGGLNAIKVGGIVLAEFPQFDNKIKNISSIGKNRVKVIFSDRNLANKLIEANNLNKHGLVAYIPSFMVFKRGVIRGVCKEYTEEVLKNIIKPFDSNLVFAVDDVKRIKRKLSKDEKEKRTKGYNNNCNTPAVTTVSQSSSQSDSDLVPTQSIIVSFRSHLLPKFVVINRVRCEVEPYVQKVLLCYNCFRYGHIGKQCKSSVRCLLCGDGHRREECDRSVSSSKCLSCQGGHLTTQLNLCPEFQRQKRIKNAMSQSNLSYNEAAKTIPKVSYSEIVQRNTVVPPESRQNMYPSQSSNFSYHTSAPVEVQPSQVQNYSSPVSNIFSQHSSSVSNNFNRQSIRTNKRMRPVSPDATRIMHQQLIAPVSLSNDNGNVLRHSSNPNNSAINPSTTFNKKQLTDTILELVSIILDKLNLKNSYDVEQLDLVDLIGRKLGDINVGING